jgi:hypothetical protein
MGTTARRAILIAALVAVPPLLTGLMYFASTYVLFVTDRAIDPQVLKYATAIELLAFFFVAALEVRARW